MRPTESVAYGEMMFCRVCELPYFRCRCLNRLLYLKYVLLDPSSRECKIDETD